MHVSDICPLNSSRIYRMARTACVGIQSLFLSSLAPFGPPCVDSFVDVAAVFFVAAILVVFLRRRCRALLDRRGHLGVRFPMDKQAI